MIPLVITLLVLVAILLLILSNNKKASMMDDTFMVNEPGVENTDNNLFGGDTNTNTVDNSDREGTSVSNAGKYADLVLKYEDRTLQFNESCQASKESTVGFKQGTDVLLDNRSDSSAKIVIGSRTFNLKAYGYKVIDLGSVGTYKIDCNENQNVLTLTVQK